MDNHPRTTAKIEFTAISEMTTENIYQQLQEINLAVSGERDDFKSNKIGYVTRASDLYKELKSRLLDEKKVVDEILAGL